MCPFFAFLPFCIIFFEILFSTLFVHIYFSNLKKLVCLFFIFAFLCIFFLHFCLTFLHGFWNLHFLPWRGVYNKCNLEKVHIMTVTGRMESVMAGAKCFLQINLYMMANGKMTCRTVLDSYFYQTGTCIKGTGRRGKDMARGSFTFSPKHKFFVALGVLVFPNVANYLKWKINRKDCYFYYTRNLGGSV